MDKKEIQVLVKIPEDWIDPDSPLLWASHQVKDMVKHQIMEELVKKYLPKIEKTTDKMIQITPEEIKDRMLTILARRKLKHDEPF